MMIERCTNKYSSKARCIIFDIFNMIKKKSIIKQNQFATVNLKILLTVLVILTFT